MKNAKVFHETEKNFRVSHASLSNSSFHIQISIIYIKVLSFRSKADTTEAKNKSPAIHYVANIDIDTLQNVLYI